MKDGNPAISVILPVYNVEKFLGECLDSILTQTFQDFEVIVSDDCSTDKSCEIAESYLPKFKGKLQLLRSEKNSGRHVGIPRNKALKIAHGKYVYFVDSDDALTENALEVLYNIAEEFNADVVHSDNRYILHTDNFTPTISKCNAHAKEVASQVKKSDIVSIDLPERIRRFTNYNLKWEPWNHMVRRELLTKNNIEFPMLSIADDLIFTFFVICAAENFVVTPNSFYIWRQRPNSNSKLKTDTEKDLKSWGMDVLLAIKLADEYMNKYNFFKENLNYRYAVLEHFKCPGYVLELYLHNSLETLDVFTRKIIDEVGTNTALTSVLFNRMNLFNLQVLQLTQILEQKDAQIKDLQRQLSEAYNVFTR